MSNKKIVSIIKNKRIELGYTQEQMARMLGYKSKSGYNNIESGRVRINIETLQALIDILKFNNHDVFEIIYNQHFHKNKSEKEKIC